MDQMTLAIDIGGSKLASCLFDDKLTPISLKSAPISLNADPVAQVMDFAMAACRDAKTAYGKGIIGRVGLTVPGLCDPLRGEWVFSPFSGVKNVPVTSLIEDIAKADTYCLNDVDACALAEKLYGGGKDLDDFLWITVSNGIGGGLVLGGQVYPGASMGAGEIGHICVAGQDGRLCGCGKKGCLEAHASGASLSSIHFERTGERLSAKELAQCALAGDESAKILFFEAGEHLGTAMAAAVNLLNLPCVFIGGGVSASLDLLRGGMEKALKEKMLMQPNRNFMIRRTSLGYEAGLYGALAAAVTEGGTLRKDGSL